MRALALALAVLTPCVAAQVRCDPEGNQQQMNACAAADLRAADAELNRVYQALMREAPAALKARIRAAQRAWLPFRDAHCAVEAGMFEGGSLQPLIRDSCLAAASEARTADLRGYRDLVDL